MESFQKKITQVILALCFSTLLSPFASASETALQREMIRIVDSVFLVFSQMYAPRGWKKRHLSWDVEEERNKIVRSILSNPNMTVKQFHRILIKSVKKSQDYHVSLKVLTQENATLPFLVKTSENRYFVVEADPSTPLKVGDEIIEFNGESVHKVVSRLLEEHSGSPSFATEKTMAALSLTRRVAAFGHKVPQGHVSIVFESEGQRLTFNTSWKYVKDYVDYSRIVHKAHIHQPMTSLGVDKPSLFKSLNLEMHSRSALLLNSDEHQGSFSGKHKIGATQSFLPIMGKIVKKDSLNPFFNYIFEHKGRRIGYVRIPSYNGRALSEKALYFQDLLNGYQVQTDMLIIDQIHNPGGSVFHMYALASMLSDRPLKTPLHQKTLSVEMITEAQQNIPYLESIRSDRQAQMFFRTESLDGYPVNIALVKSLLKNHRNEISQWDQSKFLTDPHALNVETLLPHPGGTYTKPIIVLVDELDFSGGDFFPAILQDNGRATIFGQTTAGAGGYISATSLGQNRFGVASLAYTGSIAYRDSGLPIESLGVTPDIPYSLTPDDYRNNFQGYKKALLKAIDKELGI